VKHSLPVYAYRDRSVRGLLGLLAVGVTTAFVLFPSPATALALLAMLVAIVVSPFIPASLVVGTDDAEVRWLFIRRPLRIGDARALAIVPEGLVVEYKTGGSDTVRFTLSESAAIVPERLAAVRRIAASVASIRSLPVEERLPSPPPLVEPASPNARLQRLLDEPVAQTVTPTVLLGAVVRSECASELVDAGLDLEKARALCPEPARWPAGYRLHSNSLHEAVQTIMLRAAARAAGAGRREFDVLHVVWELFEADAGARHQLWRCGIRSVPLLDRIAHGMHVAESNALLEGKVTPDELARAWPGVPRLAVVLVNDDFTTREIVADLVHKHLGPIDADTCQKVIDAIHIEGRGNVATFAAREAARRALALMRDARERGAPLRAELAPTRP
jgi:ATP-dependent Clp protease adapter protein ClpS